MRKYITLIFILVFIGLKSYAQNDPALAGMIYAYTEKAEKELKNQEKMMLLMTTGHIWTKEEIDATTDLHREFNKYLDSFGLLSSTQPKSMASTMR